MKIDFQEVYKERLQIIDKQIRIAISNKDWKKKAKLEAEKANLKERIK